MTLQLANDDLVLPNTKMPFSISFKSGEAGQRSLEEKSENGKAVEAEFYKTETKLRRGQGDRG